MGERQPNKLERSEENVASAAECAYPRRPAVKGHILCKPVENLRAADRGLLGVAKKTHLKIAKQLIMIGLELV